MSDSICRFMPPKKHDGNVKTVRFVLETDFMKLKQPFIHPVYLLHVVTSGSGVMRMLDCSYDLSKGAVFFAFPGIPFEIEATKDFEYVYISFMGAGATILLNDLGISCETPVFYGYNDLIPFWRESIKQINQLNSNILTESVLLYTLSFINTGSPCPLKASPENTLSTIVEYVNTHYRDKDISLKKTAFVFSYSEKYLSSLFKKQMKVGFNSYLCDLRIQFSKELMEKGETSVSAIAEACGFKDPMYFSKVFKKHSAVSPTDYIKQAQNSHLAGILQFLQ